MRSIHLFLKLSELSELYAFLDTFAVRVADGVDRWIIGSKDSPILQIGVDREIVNYEKDNMESATKSLGLPPRVVVYCDISGRVDGEIEVRHFVLTVMSRFGGVVQDDYSNHSWTRDEIIGNRTIDGNKFFHGRVM